MPTDPDKYWQLPGEENAVESGRLARGFFLFASAVSTAVLSLALVGLWLSLQPADAPGTGISALLGRLQGLLGQFGPWVAVWLGLGGLLVVILKLLGGESDE
jgi:hypothetical protein